MMEMNQLLHDLKSAQFYGSLELKFEAGDVVLLRKTETLKPQLDNRRDSRGIGNDVKQQ